MIARSPLFWSTLALAAVLGAVTAVLIVQIVRGDVSVTIPWGRRFLDLPERSVTAPVPRESVRALLMAAARGRTPPLHRGERTEVLEEEGGLVVNESLTAGRYGLVRAVEAVHDHGDRVTYRHLSGPLPGTEEVFELTETAEGTRVTYRGRIPVSFWGLGRLVARTLILPEYDRLVGEHMDAFVRSLEAKARRRGDATPGPG